MKAGFLCLPHLSTGLAYLETFGFAYSNAGSSARSIKQLDCLRNMGFAPITVFIYLIPKLVVKAHHTKYRARLP